MRGQNICTKYDSVYEPTNIQQLMGKKFDNITCNMPGTAINGDGIIPINLEVYAGSITIKEQ